MSDMVITSPQNQYVSLVRGLSDRKMRERERLYRIDGVKLICEAISRKADPCLIVFKSGCEDAVCERARRLYGLELADTDCTVITVAPHIFDKISEENAPEGVIAVMRYDEAKHRELCGAEVEVADGENVMILESVRDPQNVGAIMRAAAAFSVDRIIMSRDCADIYNSKAVRASMGALFSLNIDRVDSVADAVRGLKASGRRVFAAALDERAQGLNALAVERGDCVVIGNEGHGISPEVISACTESVYIPMSDGVESLNAATAAAVIAWEFFGRSK